MKHSLSLATALTLSATSTFAAEPNANVMSYLEAMVLPWAQSDVIVDAIAAQNTRTQSFDQGRILELDRTWRAEVGTGGSDLVNSVLLNDAAEFLRHQAEASGGLLTEVFVMDSQGLNVAASSPTSDYWQGDEAKFQQTYSLGSGAVHVSEIEFDESSQAYQAQVSITVDDPETGVPIGAMTIGFDAEALM